MIIEGIKGRHLLLLGGGGAIAAQHECSLRSGEAGMNQCHGVAGESRDGLWRQAEGGSDQRMILRK